MPSPGHTQLSGEDSARGIPGSAGCDPALGTPAVPGYSPMHRGDVTPPPPSAHLHLPGSSVSVHAGLTAAATSSCPAEVLQLRDSPGLGRRDQGSQSRVLCKLVIVRSAAGISQPAKLPSLAFSPFPFKE